MTRDRDDLAALKAALADNAESLLVELFGQPTTKRAREWRWGRKGSVAYRWRGPKSTFSNFETGGTGGSLLDAIMLAIGCSFPQAVKWARAWLGDDDHPKITPRVQRQTFDADAEQQRALSEAAALWRAGRRITGTAAEKYLRGRAIDRWPDDAVRFIGARDVGGITGWKWWHHCALMFPLTNDAGTVTAVQMVALHDDGRAVKHWEHGGKIKMVRGPKKGAAFRLPGDASGPLLPAEGGETALSLWLATGHATWGMMGSIAQAPLDAVPLSRTIVVPRDDDARNAPARKGLRDAVKKWRRAGRHVVEAQPWELTRGDKSDFNDVLKQHGADAVRDRIQAALTPMAAPKGKPRFQAGAELAGHVSRTIAELLRHEGTAVPFKVLRATLGLGKSEEALQAFINIIQAASVAGRPILYAAPMHTLTAELAERARAMAARRGLEIRVRVWHGRDADDPDGSGKMCRDVEATVLARAARQDIAKTVCDHCVHRFGCSYIAQSTATADLWLVPHALLFTALPAAMKDAAMLLIDESIVLAGMGASTVVRFDELDKAVTRGRRPKPKKNTQPKSITELSADLNADLSPLHRKLLAADHAASKDGVPLQRAMLAGITVEMADEARRLNNSRIKGVGKLDAPTRDDLVRLLKRIAPENRSATQAASLWRHVRDFLADDGATASGRADVVELADGGHAFRLHGLDEMGEGWRALPTLHLDATANMALVRERFPHAELVADVVAAEPHVTVHQTVGQSFSNSSLGIRRAKNAATGKWETTITPTKLTENVRLDILAKAAAIAGRTLVIAPKALALHWRKTFPDHVAVEWFGNLRGIDKYGGVALLVTVGRWAVGPDDVGRMAAILTGRAVPRVDGWYPTSTVTLAAADGTTRTVDADRHPDDLADAVRGALVTAELLQAIGRGRGSQRGPATPLQIDVYGNTPLPLPLATLSDWAAPGPDQALMGDTGTWLASAGDAAEVMGETLKAVKSRRERARLAPCPYKNISLYGREAILPEGLAVATYQRKGPGRAEQRMVYDPRRVPDPRAWLEARLGPLAYFEADQGERVFLVQENPAPAFADSSGITAGEFSESLKGADLPLETATTPDLIKPDIGEAAFSAQYAHEALADDAGGIMSDTVHDAMRAQVDALQRDGFRQEQLARLTGIARPTLANWKAGRYALSAAAAQRLQAALASIPPPAQGALL